ncbi:hypothetical protein NE865_09412 [Phthorimaea operculella]|nr:hypothetical protein NE865_09412 [Phthorimaea operculella]
MDIFSPVLPGIRLLTQSTFSLLGAPIFPEAACSALESKRQMLVQVREHLKHLSAHVALILFRACFSLPKLGYIIRTTPTWLFPGAVSSVDQEIRLTLETILNVTLGENQWRQAVLPIRLGGLGVRCVQGLGLPAFLASTHGVVGLVSGILRADVGVVRIPFQEDALEAWSVMCPAVDPPYNRDSQKAWDILCSKLFLADLTESLSGTDLARIKASACPEAGAWLHALPSPQLDTHLEDNTLRVAVSLRLGCGVCEPHRCPCGAITDASGYHGLSCSRSAGRFSRHHALNDIIRRALVSASVPCILEPPGLCRTDGKRPDGLTLVPWERGRCLLWDATCVSTYAASHLTSTTRRAGSAAEEAARLKCGKYAELVPQYVFVPFAVETGGPWCDAAKKFVWELGRRLRERGLDPRSGSYLVQRVSLAIQRGNAASVMGTFEPGTIRGGLFD